MMRHSYLELFVEDSIYKADIVYAKDKDAGNDNWMWVPKWETAKEGLSFYFDDLEDPSIRMGYIRIPEEHYLFNYHLLEETHYNIKKPFTPDQYRAIDNYTRERIANAGVPMTVKESLPYGVTGDSDDV